MDLAMPVMDGFDTTKILRKMMKEKKIPTTPIIALTANNLDSDKKKSIEAGMSDFLAKPLSSENLKAVISKYSDATPSKSL